MAAAQVTEPMQQIGHPQCHGGFTGSRVTREAHVQCGRRGCHTEPRTYPVDEQQRGDFGDPGFHRLQPDQLGVQAVQHVIDPGLGAHDRQIDNRVAGQGLRTGGFSGRVLARSGDRARTGAECGPAHAEPYRSPAGRSVA